MKDIIYHNYEKEYLAQAKDSDRKFQATKLKQSNATSFNQIRRETLSNKMRSDVIKRKLVIID